MKRLAAALLGAMLFLAPLCGAAAENAAASLPPEIPAQRAEQSYCVNTLSMSACFPEKPRIEVYNYILGDSVCRMAEYKLCSDESEAYLISLTFPAELASALEGASYEELNSLLRLAMGVPESMGFIALADDTFPLYDNPCALISAYTDYNQYTGWATAHSDEIVFVMATDDAMGRTFLGSATTGHAPAFAAEGNELHFQNVTLNFPYAPQVEGGRAEISNARTLARAELIQLPDAAVIWDTYDGARIMETLEKYLPANAADVSAQMLGGTYTMLYAFDDAALSAPVQGRLFMLDGCVLRMEATFDNAGDAYMDGVYLD